ncbi:hypothetical protein BGZ80_003050 [Entomortierella chlamydospora]|uniref:Crinkler effector protein N-terminal domain-containing protein n=1 Tax=Entomortierella chlamydospora TaxID=101097 RepID=A0A9P6MNN8_9FUNG|nr:hypothetical protein BGZ80_003050 [Entomortierella chlamydospora]
MATQLMFWCLMKEVEEGFTIFPVYISSDEWVYILQKTIKTAKPNDLSHVDADKLILWRVEIPIVKDAVYKQDYEQSVNRFKLDRRNKMETSDKVHDYIPEAVSKTIQVIVELSKQGVCLG